jgi:hypothetical protein
MTAPLVDVARGLAVLQRAEQVSVTRAERLVGAYEKLVAKADLHEVARAKEALASIGREVKPFDTCDALARAALASVDPTVAFLRTISISRALRESRFAARLSAADHQIILAELFTRIRRQGVRALENLSKLSSEVLEGYVHGIAGVMREMFGRDLPPIAKRVEALRDVIADERHIGPRLELLDSKVHGTVELPTRFNKGERSVALGPDRIVGIARRDPTTVALTFEDGTRGALQIEGVLEVRMVVEVKGRSTATDAMRQFIALQRRGNGYVIIGDKIWMLTPHRADIVEHFLVAPVGRELERAIDEAATLRSIGMRITTVPITAEREREIQSAARAVVASVQRDALKAIPRRR